MKNSKFLGMIKLSNKVMVSDPCYSVGTWCQGVVENVLPGTYNCYILSGMTDWGDRIKELYVTNSDRSISRDQINTTMSFDVGVDSGTAGIFDYDYYEKYHKNESQHDKEEQEAWYNKYVLKNFPDYKITSEKGIWSLSGYGDGGYDCFTHIDSEGYVDAIRIVFINDSKE